MLCTRRITSLIELASIGLPRREQGPFFHEFATECPGGAEKMLVALEERDILGGQPLGDGRVLWCVTEKAERKRHGRGRGRNPGGDEPVKLIFEQSHPGHRSAHFCPRLDVPAAALPEELARESALRFAGTDRGRAGPPL